MKRGLCAFAVCCWLLGLGFLSPLVAQNPLSHIPFCSSDSAARAVVEQVRFRVAGTDSSSRLTQNRAGLVPMDPAEVGLVVDDSLCINASSALAASGGSRGMPAPFPVIVVRAGDRFAVRLPWDGRPVQAEPGIVVFDGSFHRVGEFGSGP